MSNKFSKELLLKIYEKYKKKRNPKDVVLNIRYGGNIQVNNILSYLYLDATRYLPRKFELYKEIK